MDKQRVAVEEHTWASAYPRDVDWRAAYPEIPLYAPLDRAAREYPRSVCLDFLGKTYTYAEVATLADKAAKGLQDMGVSKGDRVGLMLPNSPYYFILFYAILKTGAVVVNFNPLYAEREIEHQIIDSGVEIMATLDLKVLYPKLANMFGRTDLKTIIVCPFKAILPFPKNALFSLFKRGDLAKTADDGRHVAYDDLIETDGAFAEQPIDARGDMAVLQYTGGTTGVPKGAMLSHYNLHTNAKQTVDWYGGYEAGKERILAVLPFFHVFAMTTILTYAPFVGARVILMPRFDLDELLGTIVRKKVTMMPGVPTIYQAINNHPRIASFDLSSLKICISGGSSLPMEVRQRFEKTTGCFLVEGYGLTEASPIVTCNPIAGKQKPGSIGVPYPGTIVEIVSPEDRTSPVPLGDRGEICATGPQIMLGYWKRPEATAECIVNGRLHTGDIGYMDGDGFTFLVDRMKEVILCGGYNVYPRMVEEAIYLHPKVAECAVCGIPDPYRGQTVKAFIAPVEGESLDGTEMDAFLQDKISPIEQPKAYEFREQLPKSPIGKILKKELVGEQGARGETQAEGGQA